MRHGHDCYLNARQAAERVGYEFTGDKQADDRVRRAFYAFVRRRRVTKKQDGRRLLFRPADLDRAIEDATAEQQHDRFDRMEELARQHLRGEGSTSIS